jgi:hypothetical protein
VRASERGRSAAVMVLMGFIDVTEVGDVAVRLVLFL